MRILIDGRVGVKGVGRYVTELAAGLKENADLTVEVMASRGGLGGAFLMPFTPWGRAAVARRGHRWGAHVVHGGHFETARTPLPTVTTVPDLIPLRHPASMPNPARRKLFESVIASTLATATHISVPSPATAEDLARFGRESRVSVIPNAVAPVFTPLDGDEVDLARRRFAEGRPYVAGVSEPRSHKNRGALAAVARLGLDLPVIARGPSFDDGGDLTFVPPLSDRDLRLFYGGAEVFVLPSLLEGFGLPVAEALACGTAVVCGDGVGALAYVADGVSVVDVTQPEEIARGIRALVEDDALRMKRAREGGEAARALTRERLAAATLEVYSSVVLR